MTEIEDTMVAPNARAAEQTIRGLGYLLDELEYLREVYADAVEELDDLRAKEEEPREVTEDDLPEELKKRLMPVGYEWPRFEDGEPVRISDEVAAEWNGRGYAQEVEAIAFTSDEVELHDESRIDPTVYEYGERVKRPKRPNVAENHENPPKPATEGDVISLRGGRADSSADGGDSWEQWFEDYDIPSSVDYCDKRGIHLDSVAFCFSARDNDLKRRAKKLAGVVE